MRAPTRVHNRVRTAFFLAKWDPRARQAKPSQAKPSQAKPSQAKPSPSHKPWLSSRGKSRCALLTKPPQACSSVPWESNPTGMMRRNHLDRPEQPRQAKLPVDASMSGKGLNWNRGDCVGSGKPKEPLGLTPREVAESPSWLLRAIHGFLAPT
ncbi:hypothetical protein CRG98_034578 [Punica granatum]|uniref:Uncharacterized protein n=1 Tax=Punica granatum TaxID=22663 RepID=A0A2I0ILZ5_PUNGR|nr:hypothetical protein CRG98_034578 [Punica granatum]